MCSDCNVYLVSSSLNFKAFFCIKTTKKPFYLRRKICPKQLAFATTNCLE